MSSKRLDTLEGLRGLAAIVVMFRHCVLGFLPQLSGIFPNFPRSEALTGKPFFFALNGTGAVAFFFVLSGFVLSRSAFQTDSPVPILRGILKRWPRLALPATIATLFSWLLFRFDLYHYEQAGAISGSTWLKHFAYSANPPVNGTFSDAIGQGAIFTFVRGDATYDTSLWTMKYEFFGSFAVFGLVFALLAFRRHGRSYSVVPLVIVGIMSGFVANWFALFILGVALAWFLPPRLQVGSAGRCALAVLGLYFLGYFDAVGVFAPLSPLSTVYVNGIGSVLLIAVTYDLELSGWKAAVARFLGGLSFPIYLLHVPVLCSLGSAVYIFMRLHELPHPSFTASVVTVVASVGLSLPLIAINSRWTRFLNMKASTAISSS